MLYFNTTTTSLLVSGKTFDIKEILKNSYQGRWDPTAYAWALPIELDSDNLRKDLLDAEKAAKKAAKEVMERTKIREQEQAAFAATPEGKAIALEHRRSSMRAALEEDKRRVARGEKAFYWYICCEDCEIISVRRGQHMTSCETCADRTTYPWPLTTKINGVWYTGD